MVWMFALVVFPLGLPIAEAYWATALLSCSILYLAYEARISNFLLVVAAAIVLGAVHEYFWFKHLQMPSPGLLLAELGMGAFLVVGIRIFWAKETSDRRRMMNEVVVPSAALVVLLFASNNLVNVMGILHAKTLDLYAFSFDGSLGFQPSFTIGQLMQKCSWFGWITTAMYYCILLPITLAYVAHLKRGSSRRFFMLEVLFTASFLGYLFYSFFPAAGPAYVFGGSFPSSPLPYAFGKRLLIEPIPLAGTIMRNALPSLHMTWALLIWWNMKRISRVFYWAAFVYVLFTVCGTLGTGEHYAIDLVVAFPFALMTQAVCSGDLPLRGSRRGVAVSVGLAGTVGWMSLLRYGQKLFWLSPIIPWTLIVSTIVVSLFFAARLMPKEQYEVPTEPPLALHQHDAANHALSIS
jgi:PAP2 superfamily protein